MFSCWSWRKEMNVKIAQSHSFWVNCRSCNDGKEANSTEHRAPWVSPSWSADHTSDCKGQGHPFEHEHSCWHHASALGGQACQGHLRECGCIGWDGNFYCGGLLQTFLPEEWKGEAKDHQVHQGQVVHGGSCFLEEASRRQQVDACFMRAFFFTCTPWKWICLIFIGLATFLSAYFISLDLCNIHSDTLLPKLHAVLQMRHDQSSGCSISAKLIPRILILIIYTQLRHNWSRDCSLRVKSDHTAPRKRVQISTYHSEQLAIPASE